MMQRGVCVVMPALVDSSGKALQQGASTTTEINRDFAIKREWQGAGAGKCHAAMQTLIKHPNTELLRDPECCAFGCAASLLESQC